MKNWPMQWELTSLIASYAYMVIEVQTSLSFLVDKALRIPKTAAIYATS